MSDNRDRSSPWISSSGKIANPWSPCGGCGPGGATTPQPLGRITENDFIPHPQSPVGRNRILTNEEHVLLAENTKSARHPVKVKAGTQFPVTFVEFNNKGPAKYVRALIDAVTGKGNTMGVHPPSNFPFVNAVELIFNVDTKLAKKMGIKGYRCRQRVHSQETWERELKDGKETAWAKTMSDGGAPDDPDPDLQEIRAEVIAYHDAPGFYGAAKDAQLKGPQEKLTSKTAVRVFLRQNFVGWIDGKLRSKKSANWIPVSDEVKWHSNQSLLRDVFVTKAWLNTDGAEIELGHKEGKPEMN